MLEPGRPSVPVVTSMLEPLAQLTSQWREAALTAHIQGVGETDTLRIAANAEVLATGRREVSSRTREYAKLDPEAKLSELGNLIKAYQKHVDDVTKALRHAETAHKHSHSLMKNLHDPFPALEKFIRNGKPALLAIARSCDAASGLRAQLAEREAELRDLKNQEVTVRQLRDRIAELELQAVSNNARAAEAADAESSAMLREWQERERAMQADHVSLSQECRRLQVRCVAAEEAAAEERGAHAASRLQLDELAEEHSREVSDLRVQLAVLENERCRLRDELEQRERAADGAPLKGTDFATSCAPELPRQPASSAAIEQATAPLRRTIEQLQSEVSATRAARDTALERQAQLQGEVDRATSRSSAAIVEAVAATRAEAAAASERTEAEAAGLRAQVEQLRGEVGTAAGQAQQCRQTILELQEELATLRRAPAPPTTTTVFASAGGPATTRSRRASSAGTPSAPMVEDTVPQGAVAVPVVDDGTSVPFTLDGSAGTSAATPSAGTACTESVTALLAQRATLQRRIRALEEVSVVEVRSLQNEIRRVKEDNSQLVAMLNRDPSAVDANGASGGDHPSSSGDAGRSSRGPHHPRTLFGVLSQSAVDRSALVVSHLVLSSRSSRRAFAAYQLVLHTVLLLFLAFYIL